MAKTRLGLHASLEEIETLIQQVGTIMNGEIVNVQKCRNISGKNLLGKALMEIRASILLMQTDDQ